MIEIAPQINIQKLETQTVLRDASETAEYVRRVGAGWTHPEEESYEHAERSAAARSHSQQFGHFLILNKVHKFVRIQLMHFRSKFSINLS